MIDKSRYIEWTKEDIDECKDHPFYYGTKVYDEDKRYVCIPGTGSFYISGPKECTVEEIIDNHWNIFFPNS